MDIWDNVRDLARKSPLLFVYLLFVVGLFIYNQWSINLHRSIDEAPTPDGVQWADALKTAPAERAPITGGDSDQLLIEADQAAQEYDPAPSDSDLCDDGVKSACAHVYATVMASMGPSANCVPARVGAMCEDGTPTSATGGGACSRHKGVRLWIYRYCLAATARP